MILGHRCARTARAVGDDGPTSEVLSCEGQEAGAAEKCIRLARECMAFHESDLPQRRLLS
jgi:hypothetical protein